MTTTEQITKTQWMTEAQARLSDSSIFAIEGIATGIRQAVTEIRRCGKPVSDNARRLIATLGADTMTELVEQATEMLTFELGTDERRAASDMLNGHYLVVAESMA